MKKHVTSLLGSLTLLRQFIASVICVLMFLGFMSVVQADFSVFNIGPDTWKEGVVGQPFSLQLTASPGTSPYSWSITSGTLPDGLVFDAVTGTISGVPTTPGSFAPFTVQVQDASGLTVTKQLSLQVFPSVGGLSYSRTPSGSVIVNPVTFHFKGVFGADFCDNSTSGYALAVNSRYVSVPHFVAVGTPVDDVVTTDFSAGNYTEVSINCIKSSNSYWVVLESGSPAFSIFNIAPDTWKEGVVGQPFSLQLTASPGTSPYSWSITSGSLPDGLTFNVATGIISGTPAAPGSFPPFTVQVQDATGLTVSKQFAIQVFPSVGGFFYDRTPSGTAIVNPVTFHFGGVFGADFCDNSTYGYALAVNSHYVSGTHFGLAIGTPVDDVVTTALSAGNYTEVAINCIKSANSYWVVLESGSPAFSVFNIGPDAWKEGVVGQLFSLQLTATPGTAPYTWSIVDGTLPDGLVFDGSTGLISGTPSTSGSFAPFVVQVQDASGLTVTKQFSLQVFPSMGGLSYSRSPSGSVIVNPVTFHFRGVFGADFCDNSTYGYALAVNSHYISSTHFGLAIGTPVDDVVTTDLSAGNYTEVSINCIKSVGSYWVVLESGSFQVSNIPPSPELEAIGNKSVSEGQALTFTISATSGDSDPVLYGAVNMPLGAVFDQNSGLFTWTPTFDQAGTYSNVIFTATDSGHPVASTSEAITITVNNVNRAPILAPIGDMTISEGQTLSFAVSALDPDNDALTYSATNLPAGSAFDPLTRIFSWTPSYSQAGNYPNIEFTVMDNGSPMMLAFEDITITVGNVNRAPVFTPIGSQQILEHNLLTFTVSATDPDGNSVTLSALGMPPGATFNPATGVFSWTPVYPQAGVYTPTFTATDNGSPVTSSSIDVVIAVGSNPTPVEQAQILVDTVVSANLPNSVTNSYLANLNKVGTFIDQGKTQQAINQLNAFIQKVDQDYAQGTITLAEKNQFVAMAQNLINALQ